MVVLYSQRCFAGQLLTPPKDVCKSKKALHVFRSNGTGNNLNELASNDGLSGTVVENLVLANHLTSVLGGILLKVSVGHT